MLRNLKILKEFIKNVKRKAIQTICETSQNWLIVVLSSQYPEKYFWNLLKDTDEELLINFRINFQVKCNSYFKATISIS